MQSRCWTHIIIHHTGAEEKDAAQVRRYHLSLGWRDVGYHYVIERDGRVVPGRSLELPGAHCRAEGMNFKGIGIACIGNFENHPPLPLQLEALTALIRSLRQDYGIAPEKVLGHREVPGAATLCPGRFFTKDQIRALLRHPSAESGTPPAQDASGLPAAPKEEPLLYRVQAGAFRERKNAEQLAQKLETAGFPAVIVPPGEQRR
ncbi:MAG: N-acetylmuramoyl-L-alanine amidase [Bacillota bacterium]|nr:N-acetylmuramoyl-L-alanine amidase [Bacillota bacterium]